MKAPEKNQHHIRKENHWQLRTAQHIYGLDVVATQSGALQSEIGLPPIRAIWAVIDDEKNAKDEISRRRKR